MNFYKLAKLLKQIIDEQEELLDIGEVQLMNGFSGRGWRKDVIETKRFLNIIKPLTEELKKPFSKNVFDEVSPTSYLPLCNNRCCIFESESGKIYAVFYSDKAASCTKITNDHYQLHSYLDRIAYQEGEELVTTKRWCGFYDFICNNRETILVLHGMSDTYPHNEESLNVLKKAVASNFEGLDKWHTPEKIILLDNETIVLK